MLTQLISIAGAIMVLAAFAALQLGRTRPEAVPYLLLNVLGSACLALSAGLEKLWAFVVLNTVWGLVSLRSLARVAGGRDRAGTLARGRAQAPVNDPG